MRRRRSTVVFVEAALAVVATGIVVGTPVGYAVAGAAAVAGVAGVVRRRGRGLADVAADRLGDPAAPELSGLQVVEVPTRDGELGVVGDGQGFVVVLDVGTLGAWPLADVLDLALADPARPAAVQVVVEQRGLAGAAVDPRFGPARTYRSLPVGGLPLISPYNSPLAGELRSGRIEHPELARFFPIMDDTVELEGPNKAVGVAPEIAIDDLKRKPEVARA